MTVPSGRTTAGPISCEVGSTSSLRCFARVAPAPGRGVVYLVTVGKFSQIAVGVDGQYVSIRQDRQTLLVVVVAFAGSGCRPFHRCALMLAIACSVVQQSASI